MHTVHLHYRAFAPGYTGLRWALSGASKSLVVVPVVAAAAFVWIYASSYPLTDEWLLLRNAMIAQDLGWHHSIAALSSMTWKIYEHPIVLPNLIYLALGPLVHYDSRAFICLTLACFATMLAVFNIEIGHGAWATLPMAFVLFAPSHYMELMWGFQFAMALSITLAVLGLAAFNRTTPEDSTKTFAIRLAAGCGLIVAGTCCSGEAALGFLALAVLALLKPLPTPRRRLVVAISLLSCWAAIASMGAMVDPHNLPFIRDIKAILTALGAVLVGSPVGISRFPFNWTAALGLAICGFAVGCVLVARRRAVLDELAFPIALFAFGFLTVSAIAVARPYLGNWHLQAALPAILGVYGAGVILARKAACPGTRTMQAFITALVGLVAVGYWFGYSRYGPEYRASANVVADYMDSYQAHPNAPKPYPVTGGWDFDSSMARFLARNGPHR